MYRKGGKFRAETPYLRDRSREVEKPSDDEDVAAWWFRRANDFNYRPTYLILPDQNDSELVHSMSFDYEFSTTDGRVSQAKLDAVKKWTSHSQPGEKFPPYWSRRPEFICRPPMGVPNQNMEPHLELNPTTGPQGSVLLHVRSERPHAPGSA